MQSKILAAFLIFTAAFFWLDYLLNSTPPQCSVGFVSVGVPNKYICVVGHPYREDTNYPKR